jgi:8-oxo-dGTP pyrophosphatase MutT (NUDIX family)
MKATDLKQPHKLGAGCLLVCQSTDKFLLIKRSEYVPTPNTWSLPGGRVDYGEKPLIAAKREVSEETGFDIGDRKMQLIYHNDVHAPRFRYYTYACMVDDEFKPTLNWESTDYMWCDLDTLPNPLHWGVSQLVSHDVAGQKLNRFIESAKRR